MFNGTLANTAGIRRLTIGVTGNDGKRAALEFAADDTQSPLRVVGLGHSEDTSLSPTETIALVTALNELTTKYNVEPTRLGNGFQLFRQGKAQYRPSLDAWICVSQDNGSVYAVDLDLGLCSCGDALNRRVLCKHFIACWLTHRVGVLSENLKSIVQMLGRSPKHAS